MRQLLANLHTHPHAHTLCLFAHPAPLPPSGGGIFSFLPIAASVPEDEFTPLWATPQNVDLEAMCRAQVRELRGGGGVGGGRGGGAEAEERGRGGRRLGRRWLGGEAAGVEVAGDGCRRAHKRSHTIPSTPPHVPLHIFASFIPTCTTYEHARIRAPSLAAAFPSLSDAPYPPYPLQGIPHQRVTTPGGLGPALAAAWGLNRHSVVEVVTDRTTNVDLHRVIQVRARAMAVAGAGWGAGAGREQGGSRVGPRRERAERERERACVRDDDGRGHVSASCCLVASCLGPHTISR